MVRKSHDGLLAFDDMLTITLDTGILVELGRSIEDGGCVMLQAWEPSHHRGQVRDEGRWGALSRRQARLMARFLMKGGDTGE